MKKYLLLIQLFVALGAIAPGILLIRDPSGKAIGLPLDLLENTIFANYLLPGIFLFVVHGVGRVFALYLGLTNKRYYAQTSLLLGIVLVAWIVIQVALIGLEFWLQPLFLLVGVVEFVLSYFLVRHRY